MLVESNCESCRLRSHFGAQQTGLKASRANQFIWSSQSWPCRDWHGQASLQGLRETSQSQYALDMRLWFWSQSAVQVCSGWKPWWYIWSLAIRMDAGSTGEQWCDEYSGLSGTCQVLSASGPWLQDQEGTTCGSAESRLHWASGTCKTGISV